MSFFFNQVLASNLASFNSRGFNLLISNSLVSSNLLDSYYSACFNFVGLNFVSFTLVGFTSVGFTSVGFTSVGFTSVGFTSVGFTSVDSDSLGSDFDIKLRFANAGFFSNSPSSHLASRFFSQGPPGSLSTTDYCFNLRTRPSLLLSYFKHHYFFCQVYFADNLPVFLRNLDTNFFQSAFPQTLILQPYNLHFDNSSLPHNSQGGIFFQLSLPKFRLSSRSFALYLSKPSSLLPDPLANNICSPNESESAAGGSHIPDFNRSFYSQNLPSFVGLLGESINSIRDSTRNLIKPSHTSINDSTSYVHNHIGTSIDMPIHSVGSFIDMPVHSVGSSIDSIDLSTCDIPSLHHFLNLRSRIASFFSFLDSFFLFDSPFLDSLPWDSFSLQQNPSCFPSQFHTPSNEFSLFDEELFLANCSFFPFGKRQSCLQSCYEEHFSLQHHLFLPFNHNCSSYKQHFPLNQEHFFLGEEHFFLDKEHFLANNCIFTSNTSFPSTFSHQLQLCPSFLASLLQTSTFTASFKTNFISNFKTYPSTSFSLHLFFVNFACSANFPDFDNFHNFFTFSHSIQLDIYHHLDKINPCPSASLHFSHFNNSFFLSDYFSYSANLVMQSDVFSNRFFCNLTNLAFQNHLTFNYFFCNPANLVMQNQVCINFYFSNLTNLATHNYVFSSYFFSYSSSLAIQNNIIFSDYFYNSSYLLMHNDVFLSNFFCNLTFSKLHNNVFLNNYFSTLSSLAMQNDVFLSNFFCNFTYFTSLKSCSNEANLHNCSSYLNDLLAKYSVYSLHSPSFKTLLRNHTRSFYSSTLTKTSNNLSKKASSMRSHYRIKMSFEGKVDSHFAISLARIYLSKQFPNAILLASCHQNTNHTHIHVLLFARDVNGKKLHFSNSNYKKLDIGWAKIYSQVFGEHKFQQHIDKKAQSRSWKKDRLNGIDKQKPYRVSVTNRQQQQQQLQLHQHNQQQQPQFQHQQHLLNAHNNHYKQLQLAHNIDHILPYKQLQLTHNIDHKQLYNKLSSNHFGTNIELNQPYNKLSSNHFGTNIELNQPYNLFYNNHFDLNFEHNQLHKQLYNKSFDNHFLHKQLHNQLYTKTFDLNIVQNHHLFNTFDKHFDNFSHPFNALHNHFDSNIKHFHNHFDKYLDFNSCRFYGLSLNDGVHFNTFDSIFVTKDPFFLAQDRAFDRTSNNVFVNKSIDKHLSVADKLPSFIDKNFDKTTFVFDNSIDKMTFVVDKQLSVVDKNINKTTFVANSLTDKTPSVVDKNVVHFHNNPVPSALSMNNIALIDKDLANLRPSTNLSQLHLNQHNLIQQLQLNQQNQQQNQHNLDQLQQQNFNQNLSQQHNLDLQPTNLNQQPLPQDLRQHQHNPLYNQTHLNQPINLNSFSPHTYLDLIHNLDTDYIDRLNDRVINERLLNEREINERELNERLLADSKIIDGDAYRKIVDGDFDRDDFDEPSR